MVEKHVVRGCQLSTAAYPPHSEGESPCQDRVGAKLHISLVNGYAHMERVSFEAYNEAGDFFHAVQRYRCRYGRYPARILADRIYRNRETLAFCKEHGIRLTSPALGRPPKDKSLSREQRRQEYTDICDSEFSDPGFFLVL